MDIKKLMIDDWVHVKAYRMGINFQREEFMRPLKVAEVGGRIVLYDPLPTFDTTMREEERQYTIYQDADAIEPVPLTEEILMKNGFMYHHDEKGAYGVTISPYYVRKDSPRIFCDGRPFAVWFEDEVDIKYVHELQHALRICRIDKEIVL